MAYAYLKGGKILLKLSPQEIPKAGGMLSGKFSKPDYGWVYPVTALPELDSMFKLNHTEDTARLLAVELKKIEQTRLLKSSEHTPNKKGVLMEHQARCNEIAKVNDRFGLFLDTGTGKTLTSLSIMQDNLDMKWLVMTKKAIIRTGWLADQLEFYPKQHMLALSKNMKLDDYIATAKRWGLYTKSMERASVAKLQEYLIEYAHSFVINPESFKTMLPLIERLGINGAILDESAILKNPTSDITKRTTAFCDAVKKTYLLSGKPAPNSKIEYFPQMRIIDRAIFGDNFYKFRQKYFTPHGYMGYQWKENPMLADDFMQHMQDKCIFIHKEDCLDLPEKTYVVREVELSPPAMKYYKEMEKTQMLMLGEASVSAATKLASMMKLRQITAGFVLGIEGEEPNKVLHQHKLNELIDTLEELGDKQAVIWCQFRYEIEMIEAALKSLGKSVVTAYGGTKDIDESVELFKTGKAQYILAHPRSVMYGITWVNCTYAIYYSMSYSYEEYYQSHDRIYRKGQTKPCTFIFLVCPRTIDSVIYRVLSEKGDSGRLIEEFLKEATR